MSVFGKNDIHVEKHFPIIRKNVFLNIDNHGGRMLNIIFPLCRQFYYPILQTEIYGFKIWKLPDFLFPVLCTTRLLCDLIFKESVALIFQWYSDKPNKDQSFLIGLRK